MSKSINIQHPAPKPTNTGMAIVPCGMYCNAQLQKARPGDIATFYSEWRHDKRRIVQLCRFRINSPEFTFMLRSIYGERMTIAKLMERWEAWAVVEGIGAQGFSRDEAIVIEVYTDDDKSK